MVSCFLLALMIIDERFLSLSLYSIDMTCQAFPDSDSEHPSARVLFNPMSEYINRHSKDEIQQGFDQFKKRHGYKYKDEHEHQHRLKIFRSNVRYIDAHNRAAKSYRMKLNRFADRTVS